MFIPHACGGEFWEFNLNVWDVVIGNKRRQFMHDETGKFVPLPTGVHLA